MPGPSIPWVTCTQCGKRTYHSKADARLVKRRLPGHVAAYRCPTGPGWHLGHLPTVVLRGVVGRDQLVGSRRRSVA